MLVLSSSYELATTYLQVFLPWMFCSELVLSFACVYFVITGHFLPVWGFSILRPNLASTEKSAAGKVGLTLPRLIQRCSNILQWWRNHRLKFPALSDLARNKFWVITTNGGSERVYCMTGHVVNNRRANLKSSSVNDVLFFSGTSQLRMKCSKLTKRFHIFALQCSLKWTTE